MQCCVDIFVADIVEKRREPDIVVGLLHKLQERIIFYPASTRNAYKQKVVYFRACM